MTLVLCTRDGRLLGALPPLELQVPHWPEVAEIVSLLRHRYHVEAVVLRLLSAPPGGRAGGVGAYLVEVDRHPDVALLAWLGNPMADHPLRQSWARPGGPQLDLDWGCSVLTAQDITVRGRPVQVKTWNLSSIWRIPTDQGPVWLKAVPPFLGHEGAVIDFLPFPGVPRLLGWEPGLVLMADITGEDNFAATGPPLLHMMRLLIDLQLWCVERVAELQALGLPDRRLQALAPRYAEVVEEYGDQLERTERRLLEGLVAGLDERSRALESCGVPDTLVHGDFHTGNVRGDDDGYVILDWGDSAVGHPLTDELAFFRNLSPADRQLVGPAWSSAWRRALPGCDPDAAKALLQPVMSLTAALVYADFCAAIEPDERVYHAIDVPAALRDAAVRSAPAAR